MKNTPHGIIEGEIARDPKAPTALKDYLVSCITLVRQKTPTVGDLCKSFQLRVPTDDVHTACSTPPPCECAHLAEKYGIPLVDGHCVTRDFKWLSDFSAGTDPAALTQNLKNALLPQWHRVRDDVHSNLRKTLRDIPILGNKDDLSLSVMAAIQGFYQNLMATTPTTHNLTHVKQQLKRLPPSRVTGWFDKGTSALWAGCKNFWYPRFQKAFFQQPKRFSELLRTPSPADASEQAFRYIVSGARMFLSQKPHPSCDAHLEPGLVEPLTDRVHPARDDIPEIYTTSEEFTETWQQALDACGGKLVRYADGTAPLHTCRASPTKSNTGYTKGLKGRHKPCLPDSLPPLIAPLSVPLLPDPVTCESPPVLTGSTVPNVAVSGPPIHRDHSCFNVPKIVSPTPHTRQRATQGRGLPAPNCQLLFKYKSTECASPPVIKMREVLTYASHPFQKFCKLMGRAWTLLWKMAVDVLKSRELIAMPHMLHTVKKWLSATEKTNTEHAGTPAMGIVTQWAIRLQTSDFYGPSPPTPNPPSP